MAPSGKHITTFGKVMGVWDQVANQAMVAFPDSTVEVAIWI